MSTTTLNPAIRWMTCLAVVLFASTAWSDIVWTGASADSQFWTAGNWDFSGANGTINSGNFAPGITFDDNLWLTNAGSSSSFVSAAATGGIRMGNGFTLNLNNSFLTIAGTAAINGLRGVDDNPAPNITGDASFVSLANGSFISSQFATEGLDVSIDPTSHFELRGGGDPLNSQVELTRVFMVTGSQWTLPTVNEFYEQAFSSNGANTIFINGTAVTSNGATSAAVSNWLELAVFNPATSPATLGSQTATAIPEPSSLALWGLGLALFALRKKRD